MCGYPSPGVSVFKEALARFGWWWEILFTTPKRKLLSSPVESVAADFAPSSFMVFFRFSFAGDLRGVRIKTAASALSKAKAKLKINFFTKPFCQFLLLLSF